MYYIHHHHRSRHIVVLLLPFRSTANTTAEVDRSMEVDVDYAAASNRSLSSLPNELLEDIAERLGSDFLSLRLASRDLAH
ncbi:MAG: hypothetical protein INR71_12465, partial [Terriglobus roseus]|nr:hypothetical protein [Terriglobus roseus]